MSAQPEAKHSCPRPGCQAKPELRRWRGRYWQAVCPRTHILPVSATPMKSRQAAFGAWDEQYDPAKLAGTK